MDFYYCYYHYCCVKEDDDSNINKTTIEHKHKTKLKKYEQNIQNTMERN